MTPKYLKMVNFSQNHRTTEVQKELWRSPHPTPPAEAGPSRAGCPGPCPDVFQNLQGWRLYSLPGQPVPALGHPYNKQVYSYVQMEPPVSLQNCIF